jgi:hypothetical protein
MPTVEYPKWVPSAVLQGGLQLVAELPIPPDERATHRLLTDPRMKAIWRSLSNSKNCVPSPAAVSTWRRHRVLCELSDQEIALAAFFYFACAYAHGRLRTRTISDLIHTRETYLNSAKNLHEEAQLLRSRWSDDPEGEVHAAAIDAAASFYMDKTKRLLAPSPRLVGRDQGDPYLRAYAVYLTEMACWLFGRPMYGTIATLTEVALLENKKDMVSAFNVRDWRAAAKKVSKKMI